MLRRSKRRARQSSDRNAAQCTAATSSCSATTSSCWRINAVFAGSVILMMFCLLTQSSFFSGIVSRSTKTSPTVRDENSLKVLLDTTTSVVLELYSLAGRGSHMNWYNMLLFIVGTFASVYFGLHSVVWGKAKIPKRNAFRSNKLDTISNAPVLALHSTVLCRSNVGSIFSLHWILSLLLAHRILVIGSYMLSLVVSGWFSPILWQASKIQDPLESAMTYSVILAGFLAISSTKLIYGVILPRDCLTVDCLIYWLKSTGLIVKAYIVTSIMGLFFQTGVYSMVHLLPEQNFTGHSNWLKNDIGLISVNILSGMLGYFVLCWILLVGD